MSPAAVAAAAGAPVVGVFDSGVGGLSVLRAIRDRLPRLPLHYIADSAHAPYGERPDAFIAARVDVLARRLLADGAQALVIACNTASVVAAAPLRRWCQVPVIAMEPAIKPAAARTRSGVIAVLATPRTLRGATVSALIERHAHGCRVLRVPCPGWVEQVEAGDLDSVRTRALVAQALQPALAAGADVLVLGCTHYPFLAPLIAKCAGPGVAVLQAGAAVAHELARRLALVETPAGGPGAAAAPPLRLVSSGDPVAAQALMARLWGEPVAVEPLVEPPAGVVGPG